MCNEGKNIVLEKRSSEGRTERFPEVAAELVALNVDLIMAFTTRAALAAKGATTTIPILFVAAIDPAGSGLAVSLARPGGNVTGLTTLSPELSTKQLQLIKELVPHLSRVGVLWNAANPANWLVLRQLSDAARRLGVVLQHHELRGPDELRRQIRRDRSATSGCPARARRFAHVSTSPGEDAAVARSSRIRMHTLSEAGSDTYTRPKRRGQPQRPRKDDGNDDD